MIYKLSTLIACFFLSSVFGQKEKHQNKKPINILIAISDDQSYPYTGAYGDKTVKTPAFDWIAKNGALFTNAFATSPGCAPSRSSILTGRYPWQNKEAGGHQTLYPKDYKVLVDVLEENGYYTGYTGKGCSPFNWKASGRTRNPAGNVYNTIKYAPEEVIAKGVSNVNYAANFKKFITSKPKNKPFYFWYGGYEPHRKFEKNSGIKHGKKLKKAFVPGFLPNHKPIQSDVLDYSLEIDWFDQHLGKIIEHLKEAGELDNTVIIVTSDNGMAFPRAKANCYEYGIHVPLAVMWSDKLKGNKLVKDLISLADITPTILDITGINPKGMKSISAKSFYSLLIPSKTEKKYQSRKAVYSSRERHSSARWNNLGYPIRSIRTNEYLYIRNYASERWPSGAPQMSSTKNPRQLENIYGLDKNGRFKEKAFFDIDAAPSKTYIIENHKQPKVTYYFKLSMDKRPKDELYNIKKDPFCLVNLVSNSKYNKVLQSCKNQLTDFLVKTNDPRHIGPNSEIFENYQRFSIVRPFPKPDWIINK